MARTKNMKNVQTIKQKTQQDVIENAKPSMAIMPDFHNDKKRKRETKLVVFHNHKRSKIENGDKKESNKNQPNCPYFHGDIVWAKPSRINEKFDKRWPATIVDPSTVPHQMVPEDQENFYLVKFFVESHYSYDWVKDKYICPFLEGLDHYGNQMKSNKSYFEEFKLAVEKALLSLHGYATDEEEEKPVKANASRPRCPCSNKNNGTAMKCGVCVDANCFCPNCHECTTRDSEETWVKCTECSIWFHEGCLKNQGNEYLCSDCHEKRVEMSYPKTVRIKCRDIEGVYCRKLHVVLCLCSKCNGSKEISLSEFEIHAGSRAKKWKFSVRIKDTNELLRNWIDEGHRIGAIPYSSDSIGIGKSRNETVKELALSRILDKEYTPVVAEWPIDRCCACKDPDEYDVNRLVTCMKCRFSVHQFCYGLEKKQGVKPTWVCKACEKPDDIFRCVLCPVEGGPVVPIAARTKTSFWVHTTCANYTDGVYFEKQRIDKPNGILTLDPKRFEDKCIICKQVHGCCISCNKCNKKFHAMCGMMNGCEMKMEEVHCKGQSYITPVTFCPKHSPKIEEKVKSENGIEEEQETFVADGAARCRVYDPSVKNSKQIYKPVLLESRGISKHPREDIDKLNGLQPLRRLKPTREDIVSARKIEKRRLSLGKSGVHGFGLFAKCNYRKGDFVAEYRGEVIDKRVSNLREERYQKKGVGCYMFRVNDDVIIDATKKGSVARYINHCCVPNCHSKIVETDDEDLVALIASRDIAEGEELFFDYHFNKEGEEIPCTCGVPSCRKFL